MNWILSFIYGLFSGIGQFMPVSSRAHQDIIIHLSGKALHDPIRDLVVHIGLLLALLQGIKPLWDLIVRDQKSVGRIRSSRAVSPRVMDLRLIKNACLPMIISLFVIVYIIKGRVNLLVSALFLIINGILLFIPERMLQGNKDSRWMTGLDSSVLGIAASTGAVSGLSCVGSITSYSLMRGAAKQKSLEWAYLLSVPTLIVMMILDVFSAFSSAGSAAVQLDILGYILSFAGAYLSGYFSIHFMRSLTVRNSLTNFSFYSWGAALFSFLLYLIIV